eukprot:1157262-Pelagomonas_calceolata.AAC.6
MQGLQMYLVKGEVIVLDSLAFQEGMPVAHKFCAMSSCYAQYLCVVRLIFPGHASSAGQLHSVKIIIQGSLLAPKFSVSGAVAAVQAALVWQQLHEKRRSAVLWLLCCPMYGNSYMKKEISGAVAVVLPYVWKASGTVVAVLALAWQQLHEN